VPTFNSLSRDHPATREGARKRGEHPFNSLSRDHTKSGSDGIRAYPLSTPSLGITSDCRHVHILKTTDLSTPSLGITLGITT
jgi:hypothetical protein